MTRLQPEPSPRVVARTAISDDVCALMVEAAVGATIRAGAHDPAQTVRELKRLCQTFDADDGSHLPLDKQDRQDAAMMSGVLWAVARAAGGPSPATPARHIVTGLFDPDWLARLPAPEDVAAASGPMASGDAQACHGWAPLVTRWLAALFDGTPNVLCLDDSQNAFEFTETPQWDSCVVLQLSGRTIWSLEGDPMEPERATSVVTNPGDLLLLSEGLPFRTAAPDAAPCRRVIFAFCRHPLGY